MKRLSNAFKIVIAVCAFNFPVIGFGQTGPDLGDNSPCSGENNVDDVPCPIDGGVSFLVAAGIGYGFKKAYDKKKLAKV